jgi:hypothetical protein
MSLAFSADALALVATQPLPTKVAAGAAHRPSLNWEPSHESRPEPERRALLDFERMLQAGDVLDLRAIPVAGAQVALPAGAKMFRRYGELVRTAYESTGLSEYDYPLVGSIAMYGGIREMLGSKTALLYVGTDEDFAAGTPSAALSPSGEATVYHHWAQAIRTEADLPLGAFRQARYFRPAHRSRQAAIFRPLEACDVYELHWAFAHQAEARDQLWTTFEMMAGVADRLGVPLLWSVRPPWTNNGVLSQATIAGDALLPHGQTVQLASLYDQGTRFSERFGIRYRDSDGHHPTHQVAAALTRRLVLAHLWLSAPDSGGLLPHSSIAPIHVAVLMPAGEGQRAAAVESTLAAVGLRTRVEVVGSRQLRMAIGRWKDRGALATVILRQETEHHPPVATVVRGSDRSTVTIRNDRMEVAVREAITTSDLAGRERASAHLRANLAIPAGPDEARMAVEAGAVAVVPCAPVQEAIIQLSRWGAGDVIGLRLDESGQRCVVTGHDTDYVALLARYV